MSRRSGGLLVLLALFGAGCAAADPAVPLPDAAPTPVAPPTPRDADLVDPTVTPAAAQQANAGPVATAEPATTVGPAATANPVATTEPVASTGPIEVAELLEAVQDSPFHQFGDDMYIWDDDRRIVVSKVPAGHQALQAVREQRGHLDGAIVDTPGTRR